MCLSSSTGGRICSEPYGQAQDGPRGFGACVHAAASLATQDLEDITVCSAPNPAALNREDREGCSDHADCLVGACVGRVCVKTCCSDSRRGSDRRCRAVPIEGRWEMHCTLRGAPVSRICARVENKDAG